MSIKIDIPESRARSLTQVLETLRAAQTVALTTHVNADGDGAGSEAAVAHWLRMLGKRAVIVNPTPFPATFRFLVDDTMVQDAGTAAGDRALAEADLLLVLDTAEPKRIGRVARAAATLPVAVIDHHVASEGSLDGVMSQDPAACATGELIHDLLQLDGLPRPWPQAVIEGLYAAIVTDTGSFRFANTTQRTHNVVGSLLEQGVDPEQMYRRIYASVPLHRIQLLRHALEHLEVDEEAPITSISIGRGVMENLGALSDDLEGVVEHARSIDGTEVALLFRETSDGSTKISLRSAGEVDVNEIARRFGGGGHVKASGALVPEPLDTVKPRVIEATRAALRESGIAFRSASSND